MDKRKALAALASLAQKTRLDVFRLLVTAGPAGLPAGNLAAEMSVPPNTLSFHLAHLRNAGLIRCRRQGRQVIYAADYGRAQGLLGYLTDNCCKRCA